MTIYRTHFQRNLFPGIELRIKSAFDENETQYSQLFNVKSSSDAFEEHLGAAGVGLFVKTPETVEAAEDRFYKGYAKRFQHDEYTQRIGFSWRAMKDMKTKLWGERGADLGFSMRQTKEVIHANILNNGFATNGPDGVPLFSAVHPFYRGGTQSNILDPVGTLTLLNARLMLTQFRRIKDHTGIRRISVTPVKLWVPPELEHQAKEIFTSPDRPDTANRAKNVISGAVSVFTYIYLTSTKNWGMFADKAKLKIYVYEREAMSLMEYEDEPSRLNWVQASFSTSSGHADYLGTMAANPA